MQLPFVPAGLLIALAVLGGTLVVFGLALKALDWTIDASRDNALAGIVAGLRDWRMTAEPDEATALPTAVADATAPGTDVGMPAAPIEESVRPVQSLERVAPDRRTGRGAS